MPTKASFKILPFAVSLAITLGIAATASLVTITQIPGWYTALNKPAFNPPNWLFGPVWTILYILIATAAYMVWNKRNQTTLYKTTRNIYIIQLLLNFIWSIIFFGLHQILIALIVIILLWVNIIANMYYFARFSKAACWLLLPYLLWVSFASVLNFSIYLLNR